MSRPKGLPKTGGRAKGTPNKNTAQIRDMIITALDGAGGTEYLIRQARENPAAFLTLVGKVLPMQVSGDADSPIRHVTEIRLVAADGSD